MRPSDLQTTLALAIKHKFPVVVKGKPGIGKSDIIKRAVQDAGADLILEHPVVSDPTDYKGLPFPVDGEAHFLPFKNLKQLINAQKLTACFIDDVGQAPAAVQAALMQLILERKIGEHHVSPHVVFIAATNRKEDKAAVSGMLEPVKSRFKSIVELEVNTDDWVAWAMENDMPVELVAFIRWRPDLLDKFEATKDIVNSASPRTVANVGLWQKAGVPSHLEHEIYKGAAGEAFSSEYVGFLKIYRNLPDLDDIIKHPMSAALPKDAGVKFALMGALGNKMDETNLKNITTFLGRIGKEIEVACMKDTIIKNKKLATTGPFSDWARENAKELLS